MFAQEGDIFKAFIGSCIFLLSLTFLFLRIFLIQHRRYRLLEQEKLHAEMKASQIERDAIASELHNDILPNLTAIHYSLHQVDLFENISLKQSISLLNESIDKSRNIVKNISPISLYGMSFQTATIQFIESLKQKNRIKINFTELDEIVCTSEQDNHLFRILQEIILNTIKHANASILDIEISKSGKFILVRTSDDGIGFNYYELSKRGYGLLSIESKVQYLKGVIKINDQNKKGAQFNIRIPIS